MPLLMWPLRSFRDIPQQLVEHSRPLVRRRHAEGKGQRLGRLAVLRVEACRRVVEAPVETGGELVGQVGILSGVILMAQLVGDLAHQPGVITVSCRARQPGTASAVRSRSSRLRASLLRSPR